MSKINFTLLIIILCSIKLISTDCPDDYLFCYNSKNELLGKILVNHCWKWSRFSCIPCSASTDLTVINYNQYIHQCRHYYPATNEIQSWDIAKISHTLWRFHLVG
jgi:hypothetical protein